MTVSDPLAEAAAAAVGGAAPLPTLLALPEVATTKEVAKVLTTTPRALEQARYLKRGPTYTKVGSLVRYLRADVLDYLRNNRVETSSTTRSTTAPKPAEPGRN